MKARVALFGWANYPDWGPVARLGLPDAKQDADCYQLTEFVEVEFPDLPQSSQMERRIAALERERQQFAEAAARAAKRVREITEDLTTLRASHERTA